MLLRPIELNRETINESSQEMGKEEVIFRVISSFLESVDASVYQECMGDLFNHKDQ